jgi:hypothetical protein
VFGRCQSAEVQGCNFQGLQSRVYCKGRLSDAAFISRWPDERTTVLLCTRSPVLTYMPDWHHVYELVALLSVRFSPETSATLKHPQSLNPQPSTLNPQP